MTGATRTIIYTREVPAQRCALVIECADAGYIASLSMRIMPDAGTELRFQLQRALAFVFFNIRCAEHRMETAADTLLALPVGPLAEIERAFLTEISIWQAERAAEVYPSGGRS